MCAAPVSTGEVLCNTGVVMASKAPKEFVGAPWPIAAPSLHNINLLYLVLETWRPWQSPLRRLLTPSCCSRPGPPQPYCYCHPHLSFAVTATLHCPLASIVVAEIGLEESRYYHHRWPILWPRTAEKAKVVAATGVGRGHGRYWPRPQGNVRGW